MPHELGSYLSQIATESSITLMESNFKYTIQLRFKADSSLIYLDEIKTTQIVKLFLDLAIRISLFSKISSYQERCLCTFYGQTAIVKTSTKLDAISVQLIQD